MMMTEHFRMERAGRYAYIATTIGIGKVIASHKQETNKWGTDPCIVNITDTGVAVVIRPEDGAIVTMYILSIGEARRYFANALLPMVLEAVIRRNMRKGYHEMQNNF